MSLIPHLVNGVALDLLFALIALGFMLVVSLMETINLAHGSFFALGMYIALLVVAPGGDPLGATFDGYRTLPIAWRYAIALVVAPIAVELAASTGTSLVVSRNGVIEYLKPVTAAADTPRVQEPRADVGAKA